MNKEEFDKYLDYCYSKLKEKQNTLFVEQGMGNFKEYSYNEESKTLQFNKDGEVAAEFSLVFIGSYAPEVNTWQWAWSNSEMDEELRKESSRLLELCEETGYLFFRNSAFKCTETMAYELVAVAVEYLGAIGMHMFPTTTNNMFAAIIEKV